MKLEEAMRMVKREVEAELARFFAGKRKEAERLLHPRGVPQAQHHPGGGVLELVDQVADMTMRGGKRMRPLLCFVGHEAVKGKSGMPEYLLYAMVGLELFQTFALIHDDIMDDDKERRGGPTIHRYFNEKLKVKNEKWGESMGILAGDLALMWADELMGARDDIRSLYQKMKEEVVYGQMLDVIGGSKEKADELKTAWYSVVRPLQIGSSLAFKDSLSERLSLLKTWEQYGVPAGKLFQLRDDMLDGELSEEAFNKAAKPLEKKALAALVLLDTSDDMRQLLVDFVTFVQNRQS